MKRTAKTFLKNLTDQTLIFRRNTVPMGKGTYGSKKGRPSKMTAAEKKKMLAKLKKKGKK